MNYISEFGEKFEICNIKIIFLKVFRKCGEKY